MSHANEAEVDITVDTSPDLKTITLNFLSKENDITIGFSIGEAQQLSIHLSEAITTVMLKNLELIPISKIQH